MSQGLLARLKFWFAAHCDGEWEHSHGISITTTDNPGWWVKVTLGQTGLAGRDFVPVSENIDANGHPGASRWLHCSIKDGEWHGAGDDTRLDEIIAIFLDWAERR
jgi:Immunity protein 53